MSIVALCLSTMFTLPDNAALTPFWLAFSNSIAIQPPRMATPAQREAALTRQGFDPRRVRRRLTRVVGEKPARHAKLKTVGECWQECMHGIAGNKPAREFLPSERGSTYCRRKPLCDMLRDLVNAGKTAATAIDIVNRCYPPENGHTFLKICDDLKHKRKHNLLPRMLRV